MESIAKVLSDLKMLPLLFKYIMSMQRFAEQYGNLAYTNQEDA